MLYFALKRLGNAIFVLVFVSLITRALLNAMPGDPVDSLRRAAPHPLSASDLERLKQYYGLNDPFAWQYLKWLRQMAQGDLGYSITYRLPVSELIWRALGCSVLLTGVAYCLAAVASISLGLWSATVPGSLDDRFIRFLCYIGISLPTFWLALVLIQWFSVRLRWFPPDAQFIPGEKNRYLPLSYLFLPVLVIALQTTADWTRYVRVGLLDVLHAPFIRAARARGLGQQRILWVHALPNAIVPFLTILGLSLPYVVGGELVVEMIFGWPGLGQLEYNAIRQQDHNLAMATFLMIAAATVAGSLVADLLHALLDPRVRNRLDRQIN